MLKIFIMIFIMSLTACASDPILLTKSAEEDFLQGKGYVEDEQYGKAVLYLEKFYFSPYLAKLREFFFARWLSKFQ